MPINPNIEEREQVLPDTRNIMKFICKAQNSNINLEFPFFTDFQLPGKREIFITIPGKLPGIFLELNYFVIFSDFEHFRSKFSHFVLLF